MAGTRTCSRGFGLYSFFFSPYSIAVFLCGLAMEGYGLDRSAFSQHIYEAVQEHIYLGFIYKAMAFSRGAWFCYRNDSSCLYILIQITFIFRYLRHVLMMQQQWDGIPVTDK